MEFPCHFKPRDQWCDRDGPGGFMGHTCFETYKPNGKALNDREREVLTVLMEECAEVIQAASKLIRFGKENRPKDGVPNTETLSLECGDLAYMLVMARDLDLIIPEIEGQGQVRKHDRMRWYMQSKP